jgi:hypothetical protein
MWKGTSARASLGTMRELPIYEKDSESAHPALF